MGRICGFSWIKTDAWFQLRVISKCCLMYRIVRKVLRVLRQVLWYVHVRLNLRHDDSLCFVVMKTKNINYPFNSIEQKTISACRWGFNKFIVALLFTIELKFGGINIQILFHFIYQAEIIESIQVRSTQTLYCIHNQK